jgi:uncharacterized protein YceH (UPF0502 family)
VGEPGAAYPAPVRFSRLSSAEQRVLGCLIEKRWTTPDGYPLSLNSLRLACNQATNRDPVTDFDESTVRDAAQRLSRYGLARLASGHTSRSTKYRHLAEEALGLGRDELAVLAVLLLRGPQTPGELKARSERMAPLASLEDVERVLDTLCSRGYARRLPRRPGQKEDRFEQLLGGEGEETAGAERPVTGTSSAERAGSVAYRSSAERAGSVAYRSSAEGVGTGASSSPADPAPPQAPPDEALRPGEAPTPPPWLGALNRRVEELEREVVALRKGLQELRHELGLEG